MATQGFCSRWPIGIGAVADAALARLCPRCKAPVENYLPEA